MDLEAVEMGFRATPFVTWGVGGLLYGNEWAAETGGALGNRELRKPQCLRGF